MDTLAELGARQDVARVLAEMSRSAFALGNDIEGGYMCRESLRLATETQGTFIALEALVGLAGLEAKRGNPEHALDLLWVVLNHSATLQETKKRAADLCLQLEAQLTNRQVEAAQARAKLKPLEEIVDEFVFSRFAEDC